MKLLDILKEIISEYVEDIIDLKPTHNLSDLVDNLSIISGQNGNRSVVSKWAMDYIVKYPVLANQFKIKYKIENINDFENYMNKLQIKARKEVHKDRKQAHKDIQYQKSMDDLKNIEKLALDADAEMQKKIANKYK